MTAKTIERIVELWPSLSEAARADLVARAEADAAAASTFTPEELALIERGREEFKHGRTLSSEQFESSMDAFMAGLRKKADEAT